MTLQQLADKIGITPEQLLTDTGLADKELTAAATVTEELLRVMIDGKKKSLAAKENPAAPVPVQPKNGKADNSMAALVRDNNVLVDASALLSPGWDAFLTRILPMLIPGEKRLDVPLPVLEELQAQATQADVSPELAAIYQNRLARLSQLNKESIVSVRERDLENSTSTQEILTICAALKMITPLLVLTRDEKLAADLLMLNRQPSAVGKTITVRGIDEQGELDVLFAKKAENTADGKFRITQKVTKEPDAVLPLSAVPEIGDTLTTSPTGGEAHVLKEEIARGKEAIIYKTKTSLVAKIYHAECRTARRLEKLNLLLNTPNLAYACICFPKALLYNGEGEVVGYLMSMAKGEPLSLFLEDRHTWQTRFPDWSREDLVHLAFTIADKIKFLHSRNILLGDLDPANMLVVSQKEVYFVDMDSVQLNDLPCPTGKPLYTPPELLKRHKGDPFDFSETMRDVGNENYALAVLVFRILMVGYLPCSQPTGDEDADGVMQKWEASLLWNRANPPARELMTGWFIWSHMTLKLRKIFRKIFTEAASGETRSPYNVQERPSAKQWCLELSGYMQTLKGWRKEMDNFCLKRKCTMEDVEANLVDGCMIDPQSFAICATRVKRTAGEIYRNCIDCGDEFAQSKLTEGRCEACHKKAPPTEAPKPEQTPASVAASKPEPLPKSPGQLTKLQKLKARLRMAMDTWHRI